MTTPTCVACDRPTADGYACSACAARAGRHLEEIASLASSARDVAHRQSRRSAGGATGKPGSSPPIDFGVAERLDEILNDLLGWARHVAETRGIGLYVTTAGADPIAAVARWLGGHLEWLRHQAAVDEVFRDIATAARRITGIINGPTPGRYAGPCSTVGEDGQVCGEDVTARPGSATGKCKACGAEYDVDEQQAWMRGEIDDMLATATEIQGVLLRLGVKIGYSTIAAYAAKGKIAAHGSNDEGHAVYRVGDVLDARMSATRGPTTPPALASRPTQS